MDVGQKRARATWSWGEKIGQHGCGSKKKRARAQTAGATHSQGNMELGQKIGQRGCASKKRKKESGHRQLGQHTARATWSWGKK